MKYQTKSQRCLGIDPGIANTGWAVVVKRKGGYQLLADGRIRTEASESTGSRLLKIYKAVSEVVATETPNILAIERCYHNRNVSSSQSTGGVIGIVQLIAAQYGIRTIDSIASVIESVILLSLVVAWVFGVFCIDLVLVFLPACAVV